MAALQISDSDRNRCVKLLGVLGSRLDGERSNATSMLQKVADSYRVPIHELILARSAGSSGANSSYDRQRAERAEREARTANDRAARAEQRAREAQRFCLAEPDPPTTNLPSDWRKQLSDAWAYHTSTRHFLDPWQRDFVPDILARGTRRVESEASFADRTHPRALCLDAESDSCRRHRRLRGRAVKHEEVKVVALRQRLLDRGYQPLPVFNWNYSGVSEKDRGKRPSDNGWQNTTGMPVYRDHAQNTGILTGTVYALDIDAEDLTIVTKLIPIAERHFGRTSIRYRANSARCLLPYQFEDTEARKLTIRLSCGKSGILRSRATIRRLRKTPFGCRLRMAGAVPR